MRKALPTLGEVADGAKVKDEDSIQERDQFIVVAQHRRNQFVASGPRDEMKLHQPVRTPPFPVGLVIQMLFFCKDNDSGCTVGK